MYDLNMTLKVLYSLNTLNIGTLKHVSTVRSSSVDTNLNLKFNKIQNLSWHQRT